MGLTVKNAVGQIAGSPATSAVMVDNYTNPSAPASQQTPVAASTPTETALQSGSLAYKYVVAIEGYPYLLTDASTLSAIVAWGGTDWTQALPGLYVELENEQSIDPWEPFQGGGKCTLRVQADANDTFGIDTHRKAAGAETLLRAAANRVGTPQGDLVKVSSSPNVNSYIAVDHGSDFMPGNAYIGTECIEISGADPTRLNTSRRGKYSPFGSGGSGGRWFAQHHRIAADSNGVLLNPTASQQPRTWIGKWCGVWMHTVDGSGNLCSKADALCVFAGTVVGIADDPNTGYTCVELEHVLSTVKDMTVGRDMWSSTITEGIYLFAGRTFTFNDYNNGTQRTANALNVVAGTPANVNEIQAGYVSLGDLCSALNAWLSSEFNAGRIYGTYTWKIDQEVKRTKCFWKVANGGVAVAVGWRIDMPLEIAMFLGLIASSNGQGFDVFGSNTGQQQSIGQTAVSDLDATFTSIETPWRTVLARTYGTNNSFLLYCENERGTAQDQYSTLPSADKPKTAYVLDPSTLATAQADPTTLAWGCFLMDEKYLFIASIDVQATTTTLQNMRPMSFSMPGGVTGLSTFTYGRRLDDASESPVTVRQIFLLETTFATLLKQLFYSTGTNGYNHPVYDTLGYGLGLGIPGDFLGSVFEGALDALPNSQAPMVVVINENIKLSELLGADLILRHAFPIWRSGGISWGHWVTPTTNTAIASLSESNKAEPTGNVANHRTASMLTDQWVRNYIKIDYDRVFTIEKDGQYQSEIAFEDHVSVDDTSGKSRPFTIKARNTYSQFLGTGAGIEALAPYFMATMPLFSRPAHKVTRSIDQRYFEGYAPGDVVTATDAFMRDPETGERGVTAIPGLITRIKYNPGGPTPGNPSRTTAPSGEVDLLFLDLHRDVVFSPAAQVDDGYPYPGFSAGYNSTTWTLALQPHAYSEVGESADHTYFAVGDAVVIVEIDPTTVTAPQYWKRKITATSNGLVTLNQSLDGWDATKLYRVINDNFSAQQASQQGEAVFASATSGKILGRTAPYHWSSVKDTTTTTANAGERAELIPTLAYGDGVPLDVGHERALIRTLNAFIDGKSLHCSPALSPGFLINALNHPHVRCLISMTPIFLGREMLSTSSALRFLRIAPLVRYAAAAASTINTIWVTVSRSRPVATSGWAPTTSFVVDFQDKAWTTSWEVTGTAAPGVDGPWYTLPEKSLPLDVKTTDGIAWLCVEAYGRVDFGGFALCMEGARTS